MAFLLKAFEEGDERALSWARRKLRRLVQDPGTGCAPWPGALRRNGYGTVNATGSRYGDLGRMAAHAFAWMLEHRRDIPRHMQLDHLCRNRKCCNVHHLELVTPRENQHRSEHTYINKTHCNRGHPFDGYFKRKDRPPHENPNCRYCRRCRNRRRVETRKRALARRKEAQAHGEG
jgi:hypothetical protein